MMRSSYFATALQIFEDILEGEARLTGPGFERLDVLEVFGKRFTDSGVDEVGQTPIGLGGFET
jgi:hypothetical protein